jgi:general stress protein 26
MDSKHPTEQYAELARSFSEAMLIMHSKAGTLRGRPMTVAEVDALGDIWFVTSADSGKIDELALDNHALVVMQGSGKYLSISGRAEVLRDPQKIERLWKETWRIWFKDKNDPDMVLIRLAAGEVEYWDTTGLSGVKFVFLAAKAYITGEPLKDTDNPKNHAKIVL